MEVEYIHHYVPKAPEIRFRKVSPPAVGKKVQHQDLVFPTLLSRNEKD
jgi:hypothetical protein